ncbi:hypothetical protein FCU45_01195 [Sulfurimonas crateris]|uniref:Uncharacterized protein n=1 Tax=Sulfurimonas crateris TaxID=2574727 RepID=A0A4V6X6A6_9BACT|nr:hypothetical protein [Sulfurimonas crateris]TKI71033.1 hypothetical protein FCU45_01195 [Sulfurimonas crateris]
MKKDDLEFCFKGSRTYVQGPDIFDAVVDTIKNDFDVSKMTDIKYAAHDMLLANANLIVTNDFKKEDFETINSIITFKQDGTKYYAVVSQSDTKIECSNEYSEEIVRTQSIIKDKIISFENILEDSITEITVSMNKYFLQETETKDGKWIVTKFEYPKLINLDKIKNKTLKLELTNNFNNKLTKSTIFVNEEAVGYLYFSLI